MQFGSKGWQHPTWMGSFYPDDLPSEWRLPYYSNEFDTVLIPSRELLSNHKDQIQEWLDDSADDFSFFVEFDAQQEFSVQLQNAQLLLPQLAGIVLDMPVQKTGYTVENIELLVKNTLGRDIQLFAPEPANNAKIAVHGAQLAYKISSKTLSSRRCLGLLSSNTLSMDALKQLLGLLHTLEGGCDALFLAGSRPEIELLRQATNIYHLSY